MKIPERLANAILQACDDSGEEIRRLVARESGNHLFLDAPELSAVIFKHMRTRIGNLSNEREKAS